MLSAESDEMETAYKELVDMTPDPMNSMLEKQPRNEAKKRCLIAKKWLLPNIPPTAGNTALQSETVV